jgi:biopolymer transport protein ExbD
MAVLDKKKSKVSDKIPSASMADIAFLLLIFFLVTTTFPKDKGLAIVLPEEGGEVQISAQNILHIIIRPDGIVEIRRGDSPQTQTVRPSEVEGIWRSDVSTNDNLIAAVKTYPDAPYRYMVDVLDALHTAGAERISLQLFEG